MTHNQIRSYLCIQKILETRFRILFYICLNTKQIHGPKVLKIGSIIVTTPHTKRARLYGRAFACLGEGTPSVSTPCRFAPSTFWADFVDERGIFAVSSTFLGVFCGRNAMPGPIYSDKQESW